MAAMTLTTVVFVVALVFGVDAADRCYDCDATDDGEKCVDPVKNNIRVVPCELNSVGHTGVQKSVDDVNKNDIDIKFGTQKKEYDCYALYYQGDGTGKTTGVYRGCTDRPPDAKNSCDLLIELLTDGGNVTKCEYCGTNECNRDEMKLNGSDDGGNGANSVQLSVVLVNLMIFCAIFAF